MSGRGSPTRTPADESPDLLQNSSTGPGRPPKQRTLVGAGLFTTGPAPLYFDPKAAVESKTSGSEPLYCKLIGPTGKKLQCYSLIPEKNRFEHRYLYEEFFATGIILAQNEGAECKLFDVKVETV